MATEPLHRLPNGTWIRLSEIKAIYVFTDLDSTNYKVGITVFCGNSQFVVPYEDRIDAQNYADFLATLVRQQHEEF